MSRSYRDSQHGHAQRIWTPDDYWSEWRTAPEKRYAKRRDRRTRRRLNKPDIRCPDLIYPYLNKTSWYVKGSYLVLDYLEYEDWEHEYDWYSDMLEEYWAYEYGRQHEDWNEPDFDYYPIEIYDDYGDYDYDY